MRHRVYGKHLGRNKDQRKGLFKGLVYSLLSFGTVQTSEVKAKAIKGLVDKIINSAKENSKFPKPLVQSFVNDKILQKRLTDEIIPKLGTKTSGFTRTVRLGTRLGDQTSMVRMSLIGAEQLKPLEKGSKRSLRPNGLRVQGLGVSKKTVTTEANKKEKQTIKVTKKAVLVKSKLSKTK